jgi:adenylate cyclase
MKRPVAAGLLGITIGVLGVLISASPLGVMLAQNVGLHGLFLLRGPREAPPETIIATMDMASVNHFDLDYKPENWPRALHARLIERLATKGVDVVAMDILFEVPKNPVDDKRLADAIALAGNVIICSSIQRQKSLLKKGADGGNHGDAANIERLITPLPKLARAAVAQAPFPLPKRPVKVNQFWAFKQSAGDIPTLPVAAIHLYLADHYEALIALLENGGTTLPPSLPRTRAALLEDGGMFQAIHQLKTLSRQQPALFKQAQRRLGDADYGDRREERAALRALLSVYTGTDSRYLNYYGPPGALHTVPYHRIFDATTAVATPGGAMDLTGKVVFIGLSQRMRLDQEDGYYTVYSNADGSDISGVEIAATAFSNLLEDTWLRHLTKSAEVAVMLAVGLVTAFAVYYLPLIISLPAVLTLSATYAGLALWRFSVANTWWPVAVPLLVLIPIGYLSALMLKHRDVQRERRNIRTAFGMYLPDTVVNRLAKDISQVTNDARMVHGTCLFADAAQYTPLAEALTPDALRNYLNRYYEIIFQPIRDRGGIISDVVGDAVLALWTTAGPDTTARRAACASALKIGTAIAQAAPIEGQPVLPARIGVHAGHMQIGSVGAIDHYEYRAVGEVVNTASRIEGLNKHLGTHVLASDAVLEGIDNFQIRPVGSFTLVGKSNPVALFELLGPKAVANQQLADLCNLFQAGLEQFRRRAWDRAEALFTRAIQISGRDGPSAFYLEQCRRFIADPPGNGWQGDITMEMK